VLGNDCEYKMWVLVRGKSYLVGWVDA